MATREPKLTPRLSINVHSSEVGSVKVMAQRRSVAGSVKAKSAVVPASPRIVAVPVSVAFTESIAVTVSAMGSELGRSCRAACTICAANIPEEMSVCSPTLSVPSQVCTSCKLEIVVAEAMPVSCVVG